MLDQIAYFLTALGEQGHALINLWTFVGFVLFEGFIWICLHKEKFKKLLVFSLLFAAVIAFFYVKAFEFIRQGPEVCYMPILFFLSFGVACLCVYVEWPRSKPGKESEEIRE